MTRFQLGFLNRQMEIPLVLFGLVLAFAFPKYEELSDRMKVGAAYRLANDSQIRVSEFYSLSARFPQTEVELRSVTGDDADMLSFIEAVEVDSDNSSHDVVIRIYLDDDEVDSEDGSRPVLFMTGNRSGGGGYSLRWRCGAEGLDAAVLPHTCTS
ncbi:MAG: hypothetical protein KJN78_06050 [Gammaproteobacteria bacterium]|nr:hypothetical protein [Gammaproteobacteria bacterium]